MAAVVEMIHTATLVHDDVIDIAKTRRGRPSVNVVWGNHTSVLAGDWLYMQAFQVALRERSFPVLDLLISPHANDGRRRAPPTRAHRQNRRHRSRLHGADRSQNREPLFRLRETRSHQSPAQAKPMKTRLGEYAWNLGIAFQLIDDILDFTSREKILGKPVGNDLREGKVTLPLIYALETADAEERKLVETILADGNYDQVPFGKILQILNKHHGIERAQERAREFTEKARSIIAEFPDSPYQKALNAVTDLVTGRDH